MTLPATAILDGLADIANTWRWLAIGAHAALLLFVLAWRHWSPRGVTLALTLPLISVSLLAWWVGNPFNGVVFLVLAQISAGVSTTMETSAIRADQSRADRAIGVGLVFFGVVYPHFVAEASWVGYLYAAPFALIPCPTLAVLIGFSLLTGFNCRYWSMLLAAVGLVYGVVGVAVLGVQIDALLVAGAFVLIAKALRTRRNDDAISNARPRRVGKISWHRGKSTAPSGAPIS